MHKKILAAITLLLLTFTLTGCYDRVEVDDLAYPLAIGVDKGKSNEVKVTLQFDKSTSQGKGSEGGGGGGGESKDEGIITIESPTVISAVNTANAFSSKRLNLSHAKILVFSQEIAREGISKYIRGFLRSREIRPTIMVMVARNTAEDYIKSVKPMLTPTVTRFYELKDIAVKYSGLGDTVQFQKFYFMQQSRGASPIALLAGVNANTPSATPPKAKTDGSTKILGGGYKAGEIPRTGAAKAENMGLALFRAGKAVGELNGLEALYYQMVSGHFRSSELSIPDPAVPGEYIVLAVKRSRRPVHEVRVADGKPDIRSKVILEGDITSLQSGEPYETGDNITIIEQLVQQGLAQGIKEMLEKTAAQYDVDIVGFGDMYKKKLLTWQDWVKVNWPQIYRKSTFQVNVDFKIRRTGLLVESHPDVLGRE